ncbi:MAG: hypothetical protein GOV02_02890 [Candidatus Aenigmarchaeota archaeon]|nr:hypothetical protein [Candidatus Aenigmarchaeota archaeon]
MKKTIVLIIIGWLFLAASYVFFKVIEELDSSYQTEVYQEELIENTYWRIQNLKVEV